MADKQPQEQTQQTQPTQGAQAHDPPKGPEPKPESHHGRDFAKKLGNAATFGAGATLGGDLVNSVLK